MRDHLGELSMLGIISAVERNGGRRGGTYWEYSLNMDIEMSLNALEETVARVGVHESLTDMVDQETTLSDYN